MHNICATTECTHAHAHVHQTFPQWLHLLSVFLCKFIFVRFGSARHCMEYKLNLLSSLICIIIWLPFVIENVVSCGPMYSITHTSSRSRSPHPHRTVSNGFPLHYTLTAHAKTFLTLSRCGVVFWIIFHLLHCMPSRFLDLPLAVSYRLSLSFSNDTQSHTFSNLANATKKQPLAFTTTRKHISPIQTLPHFNAMHSECVFGFFRLVEIHLLDFGFMYVFFCCSRMKSFYTKPLS